LAYKNGFIVCAALMFGCTLALAANAQTNPTQKPATGESKAPDASAPGETPVIVAGTVSDDATKTQILARVREIYGANRVVDNLAVANVQTPPNWGAYVQRVISPALKTVSKGELSINGTTIAIRGDVANEGQRLQLPQEMAAQINNPTYIVKNSLRVVAAAPQAILDQALANRTIEFELGSAVLTNNGRTILDQMIVAMKAAGTPKVELIGHTDASGNPDKNLALSQARADSVKAYLVEHSVDAAQVSARGLGAERPIASNNTAEGRAKNRRIEFRVVP
jgi:OmpA-OmpF porin, OOP family